MSPPPPDLDVGIPPGSPTSWARRFPAVTPDRPLFPKTGSGGTLDATGKDGGKNAGQRNSRTVVRPARLEIDTRITTSFGAVRIITWDLAGHLAWVNRDETTPKTPVTGAGAVQPLPFVNDGLYWAGTAAMLRLLLHPQLVSEKELIAHLAEIGEPMRVVLDNAVSERALQPACKKLRKMIAGSRAPAKATPGKTPRQTMLKRFLAEELVVAYPFDPEAGFGRRFMLWSEEMEPFLSEYVEHADSFLRRNAATALGRYKSDAAMRRLADLAARTDDPVLLMRSLSAVGAYRSLGKHAGLLERMQTTKDPVERVALVVAVGRSRMVDALPFLLKQAKTKDQDLLMAVVAAVARIGHPGEKDAVKKFAARLARLAQAKPDRYRVKLKGAPKPDIPDGPDRRGEVIEQLARLVQVRLEPNHKKARPRVLGWLSKGLRGAGGARVPPRGPGIRGMPRRAPTYSNNSLRQVHKPVMMLYLETLRRLGKEGIDGLKNVAQDQSAEPALRGHAMSQLPFFDRSSIAAEILEDKKESVEMKIYAFEVVANDAHKKLREFAQKMLEACGKANAGEGRPEQRYLWVQAIRAMGRRKLLKAKDLLPLLKHAEARSTSNEKLHRKIRDLVVRLVNDAAAGLKKKKRAVRIQELLDLVIKEAVNPLVIEATRARHRAFLDRLLEELKGHRGNIARKNNASSAILHRLLGFRMGFGLRERAQARPMVLLEEEILLELGRTKEKAAGEALVKFLGDHKKHPLRAHVALALGLGGFKDQARSLVSLLADADGFVRFCAYESLRNLTGQDIWADWMYGDRAERVKAAEQYLRATKAR